MEDPKSVPSEDQVVVHTVEVEVELTTPHVLPQSWPRCIRCGNCDVAGEGFYGDVSQKKSHLQMLEDRSRFVPSDVAMKV